MSLPTAAPDLEPALALLDGRFAQSVITLPSGARVALRMAGPALEHAPMIVLLHGIGSGAASWLHVALALAAKARVVAWDAPGYGESDPLVSDTPAAADYAERLGELLAALRIERCVLVGHSLGALIAAAFAAGAGRHVVQRLVLISPARGYGGAGRAELREQVLSTRLSTLRTLGIEGIAADAPKRMLSAAAHALARAWVQWNAARLNPAGYTQAVQMLCGADILAGAVPTMPAGVLCGDADVVTPPDACREIATRFGTELLVIPRAGHASPIEQPTFVARRIAGAADLVLQGDAS